MGIYSRARWLLVLFEFGVGPAPITAAVILGAVEFVYLTRKLMN